MNLPLYFCSRQNKYQHKQFCSCSFMYLWLYQLFKITVQGKVHLLALAAWSSSSSSSLSSAPASRISSSFSTVAGCATVPLGKTLSSSSRNASFDGGHVILTLLKIGPPVKQSQNYSDKSTYKGVRTGSYSLAKNLQLSHSPVIVPTTWCTRHTRLFIAIKIKQQKNALLAEGWTDQFIFS